MAAESYVQIIVLELWNFPRASGESCRLIRCVYTSHLRNDGLQLHLIATAKIGLNLFSLKNEDTFLVQIEFPQIDGPIYPSRLR
jgi:hypothetical protein